MSLIKGILKNNNLKEIEVKLKGKFYKDEVFYEDEARCIYFEGVVLNLKELLKKYEKKNLSDLIIYLYTKEKGEFFSYFKGNFCGIYHDKEIKKTLVFTDQHGNKPVFYFSKDDGNEFFFSDNVKEIINIMKAKSYKVSLNLAGVYSLLTYGYMYSNNTLFDYVFRLLPGTYIIFENNQFEVISYYKVNNSQILAVSEDEAIIQLDKLFLEATKLQADKNKEYGFDNYTPLSAGLDSRMTAYALNRLGVENVINFTYSQSQQLDNTIPSKISAELKNVWIFKSLDNGLDLFDIEESIDLADSLIYYLWASQLNGFLKFINTDTLGVIHTGVIGDVVVGSFYRSENKRSYQIGDGAFSLKLINKAKKYIDLNNNIDYEIGMLYNRGYNGACLGYSTSFHQYTEAMSPFMYLDFFDYCLSLPLEYRISHNIYYKWVKKMYPEALKYSHNGLKIKASNKYITYRNKKIPLNGISSRMKTIIKQKIRSEIGMNPLDKWYKENDELRVFINEYYKDARFVLDEYDELLEDVDFLFSKGNVTEKILVMSLLGTLRAWLY